MINEKDCGTKKGLVAKAVIEGGDVIVPLSEKILGRSSAIDVQHPVKNETILKAGELIDEASVEKIDAAGIDSLLARSVLTCDSKIGVCAKCYGRDLAIGGLVNHGEAVGVIAAQSIGEPGTQLTMRTFHIGGAAQRGAEQSKIESSHDGTVSLINTNIVTDSKGRNVVMSRSCELIITGEDGREKARHKVPYGARLPIKDGDKVKKGEKLAEWDPYTIPIITEKSGKLTYRDVTEGVSMSEVMDEVTGISSKVIIDWKQQKRDQLLSRY